MLIFGVRAGALRLLDRVVVVTRPLMFRCHQTPYVPDPLCFLCPYVLGSAAMFLSGAIGFELLGAKESSIHGTDTVLYSIFYTIEESLEMFGVIFLIWILLTLLEGNVLEIKMEDKSKKKK